MARKAIRGNGLHYPPGWDTPTDHYADRAITIDLVDDHLRIETGRPKGQPQRDFEDLGSPGVCLDIDSDNARRLAEAILKAIESEEES